MLASSFWRDFGSPELTQAMVRTLDTLSPATHRIAVALSGGADSAMLAVSAALVARERGIAVHCFHIHHGLQSYADTWQEHAHALARMLALPCHTRCVRVDSTKGDGMESAARDARYQGFTDLAVQTGVSHILLAHHRNDQAETVLLRLLRGAGPTGLAAMASISARQGITYLRPWLDIDRASVLQQATAFAHLTGWTPVQDPTNADARYARAAIRERLAPALDERWPGWQRVLARHAQQSAQASEILTQVAQEDLAGLDVAPDGSSFSLAAWRALSCARQALVLRHWLNGLGKRMPTDARLQDLMRQMRDLHALGHDRSMSVKHGSCWIRCVRGRVLVTEDKHTPVKKLE